MRSSRKLLLLVALLVMALPLAAQVRFEPANPTSADYITAIVSSPSYVGFRLLPVEIVGSEIRFTVRGNGQLPIVGQHPVVLGQLPAGTYQAIVTIQTENESGQVVATTTLPPVTLVVAPGHFVPTLDPAAIALLAAALGLAGFFAMRRF